MILLSVTLAGMAVMTQPTKSYAKTQEEIIAEILERNPELRGKQTCDPAPGHEYGGSFDDLVQSVKDHNDQLVRDRAAERGLTIREYLEQTGQTESLVRKKVHVNTFFATDLFHKMLNFTPISIHILNEFLNAFHVLDLYKKKMKNIQYNTQ